MPPCVTMGSQAQCSMKAIMGKGVYFTLQSGCQNTQSRILPNNPAGCHGETPSEREGDNYLVINSLVTALEHPDSQHSLNPTEHRRDKPLISLQTGEITALLFFSVILSFCLLISFDVPSSMISFPPWDKRAERAAL